MNSESIVINSDVGGLEHNFIFPYVGNNHPNWLIFFRVETTNQPFVAFFWGQTNQASEAHFWILSGCFWMFLDVSSWGEKWWWNGDPLERIPTHWSTTCYHCWRSSHTHTVASATLVPEDVWVLSFLGDVNICWLLAWQHRRWKIERKELRLISFVQCNP